MSVIVIFELILIVNYKDNGLDNQYKNWLSDKLGVPTERISNVEKNICDGNINMEVLSYYREDNIVTLAIKFNQINNNAFQEELNIEHLKIVQDNNVSGELFGQFS